MDILEQYKKAWKDLDLDTLEKIRKGHPEDARFSLHLRVALKVEKPQQTFTEVKAGHDGVVARIKVGSIVAFHKALQSHKPATARKIAEETPNDDPYKEAMMRLLPFIK